VKILVAGERLHVDAAWKLHFYAGQFCRTGARPRTGVHSPNRVNQTAICNLIAILTGEYMLA